MTLKQQLDRLIELNERHINLMHDVKAALNMHIEPNKYCSMQYIMNKLYARMDELENEIANK